MKEHFEMLRLLELLPEDNFTYQLQKADWSDKLYSFLLILVVDVS